MHGSARLYCPQFADGSCRSCSELPTPLGEQRSRKLAQAAAVFGTEVAQLTPVSGPAEGFRNKAKMAAGGHAGRLTLGLNGLQQLAVDLCDCPLYPRSMRQALGVIRRWLNTLGIPPYDLSSRQGELKFVLLTEATPDRALQLRLVLRSLDWLPQIRAALATWQADWPDLQVVSVNLQPEPMAVLEGEQETLLTTQRWLGVPCGRFRLQFGVRSFLQTNPVVAGELYAQAGRWIDELAPTSVLDLYCGIGGFAFHASAAGRKVRGIELSAEAIEGANESLRLAQSDPDLARATAQLSFACADATVSELGSADLVVVNPPRRGLGKSLCSALSGSDCRWLIYSSCHLPSLQRDLADLSVFQPQRWQLFDMFPHTTHFETLVLLQRR